MTLDMPTLPDTRITPVLNNLENSIAKYPRDLREIYAQGIARLPWTKERENDGMSDFEGLSSNNLALAHRVMFASAFVASATSLPNRETPKAPVTSTQVLDAVTNAGFPAREFLRHYGKYGNQFTWKLLRLTGRIGGRNNQPVPDLV